MTYSNAILGVPCGLLRAQRQTAAAVAAPGAGAGGQNLDMALVIADGGPNGRADPAYDAHSLPLGEWAMAVWAYWKPISSMQLVIDDAKQRIEKTRNKWAVCYGPGAALVMTCKRIEWTILSATRFITDLGQHLDLQVDPPVVVIRQCFQAVQRWRWKRLERVHPQLASKGSGRGPFMEPIWNLLKSKTASRNWTEAHKGCLKSAAAGRQYTQVRVMQCGWAQHNRCTLCLHRIVEVDKTQSEGSDAKTRSAKELIIATLEQICRAPKGDLVHRAWKFIALDSLRCEKARGEDICTARSVDINGHPAWERGLLTRPSLPMVKKSTTETFRWHVKPRQLPVAGRVYPDGSCRGGPMPELERCGGAFVVVDGNDDIIASAYGAPPPWIDDIGGAEAWAIYQSTLHTLPEQCEY